MTEGVSAIIVALGGLITAGFGGAAMWMTARAKSGRVAEVLRRLWAWTEDGGLADDVPASIRRDVEAALEMDEDRKA